MIVGLMILSEYCESTAAYPVSMDKQLIIATDKEVDELDKHVLEANGWSFIEDEEVHGVPCWEYYTGH
jgi:hypothetical protein